MTQIFSRSGCFGRVVDGRPYGVLAALLLVCAACDGAGDAGPAGGTFDLRVSGALDVRHEGRALFATIRKDGVDVFGLQLQAEGSTPYVLVNLDRGATGVPAPGTYPILPGPADGADAFTVTYTRSQEDPFLFDPFFGTEGTLTVTASGASRVTGRLSFSADAGSGRIIQVEGTFDAVPGR